MLTLHLALLYGGDGNRRLEAPPFRATNIALPAPFPKKGGQEEDAGPFSAHIRSMPCCLLLALSKGCDVKGKFPIKVHAFGCGSQFYLAVLLPLSPELRWGQDAASWAPPGEPCCLGGRSQHSPPSRSSRDNTQPEQCLPPAPV